MALSGVWNRISGGLVALAIGRASSDAVTPVLENAKQRAWAERAVRVLSPGEAADAEARGIDRGVAYADDAKRQGVGRNRYLILRDLAQSFPGLPDLLSLWRRGRIDRAEVVAALRRQGYSEQWAERLATLTTYLLPPSDVIRLAVHEVYNPGRRAALDLDAEFPAEFADRAALLGISEGDARDLWAGHWDLPSYQQGAEMLFRGELSEDEFGELLAALDYAPTWRAKLEKIARRIPTMSDFQRLARREVYNPEQRRELQLDAEFPQAFADRAALHGMSEGDARDLWAGGWRLPSAGQGYRMLWREEINEGELRGLLKALDYAPTWRGKLANIARPAPGRIDLRRMLAAGILTPEQTERGYMRLGYTEADARRLVRLAAAPSGAGARELTAAQLATEFEAHYIDEAEYRRRLDELGYAEGEAARYVQLSEARLVKRARDATLSTIRANYVGHRLQAAEARAAVKSVGVSDGAADAIMAEWQRAEEANRAALTPVQIRDAYRRATFTLEEALARLRDRGYSDTDSHVLLGLAAPRLTASQIIAGVRRRTIPEAEGLAQLRGLGYTLADAQELLEQQIEELSSRQVLDAVDAGAITPEEGLQRLLLLGYRAADAELLMAGHPPPPPA